MKKIIIVSAILGSLITIVGFYAYDVYQMKKVVAQNSQTIVEIVNYLNSQIKMASSTKAN